MAKCVDADQTPHSVASDLHLIWVYTVCKGQSVQILNPSPAFANSVDPDQLASSEASCSGSALFAIKYVNLYQLSGSSNLNG